MKLITVWLGLLVVNASVTCAKMNHRKMYQPRYIRQEHLKQIRESSKSHNVFSPPYSERAHQKSSQKRSVIETTLLEMKEKMVDVQQSEPSTRRSTNKLSTSKKDTRVHVTQGVSESVTRSPTSARRNRESHIQSGVFQHPYFPSSHKPKHLAGNSFETECSYSDPKFLDSRRGTTPSGTDSATPGSTDTTSSTETSTPRTPATPTPNNGVVDVGDVRVASVSTSCYGVVLEPSIVLTLASCVYPNHWSASHSRISFMLNGVSKEVEKAFGNPQWISTGERKTNLALLKLAQPMTGLKASHLTTITWSPYALEDIGESLLATNEHSSPCQTASKKTKQTNTIRHVEDSLVTVKCQNPGEPFPGSPLYRTIDGQPVIYGLYFGHCTSGSLDRKITGSCGVRISKEIFQSFCAIAEKEKITLPDCNSEILNQLQENYPTLVVTSEGYNAVKSTINNTKGAVFVYHSSASTRFDNMVYDIEAIQRAKFVYDKFRMAIVDIDVLPFNVTRVPYIEFRIPNGKVFIVYTKDYDFKEFKNFMVKFSQTGAPVSGSINVDPGTTGNLDKRAVVASPLQPINTNGVPGQKRKCDPRGYEDEPGCKCHRPYFGDGEEGNCQDRREVVQANCRYHIGTDNFNVNNGKTYDQVVTLASASSWCDHVFAFLTNGQESVRVHEAELTLKDCVDEIFPIVNCSRASVQQRRHVVNHENYSTVANASRRSVVAAGNANYLGNFYNNQPPTNALGVSHFCIYQDWWPAATNKFSTLFRGDKGIPEYTAYKLNHNQLNLLTTGPRHRRAAVAAVHNGWFHDNDPALAGQDQGSNAIYLGRGRNGAHGAGVHKGHLNPSQINNYDLNTMVLTHTYTNAYPQFARFNHPRWYRDSEIRIFNYAKGRCHNNDPNSELYLITGLSEYENLGGGGGAVGPHLPVRWPAGVAGAIVQAHSMWTVGCCTWTNAAGTTVGESISTWGNNVPGPGGFHVEQFDLATLAGYLYPGGGFLFFPTHPQCNVAAHTPI